MNRKLSYRAALSLLIGLTFPGAAQAQGESGGRVVWEYYLVVEDGPNAPQQLNSFGQEGWELVSVSCTTSNVTGGTDACYYYFKRPK